jgi:energy-coupling factor transporter ATP-binding protein EcfA2
LSRPAGGQSLTGARPDQHNEAVTSDPSPPALVLRADPLRATRQVPVAAQVSLAASAGEVVVVEGANGSGQSTLLAAAAGLLPAGPGTRRPASVGFAPERRRGDQAAGAPLADRPGPDGRVPRAEAARRWPACWTGWAWPMPPTGRCACCPGQPAAGADRADAAASLATAPFALAATAAAWIWPALGQASAPHRPSLLVQVSQHQFAGSPR